MVAKSLHPTQVALHYETTQGQPPGYTVLLPGGTAAGWAAEEGVHPGGADRIYVIEASPAFIREGSIEDPRMKATIFQKYVPIKGLRNADGGSITVGLHGSESATADGTQVAETGLMRLLGHAFGGLHRGNTTAATATVDDVNYDVTSAANLEAGALVAAEDGDAPGRLFPQRVTSLAGTTVTADQELPFALADTDVLHAVATAYVDSGALSDCNDPNYSTVSLLIQKDGEAWESVGGVLSIDSMEFPRNDVPRFTFSVQAAGVYPPGDGSPGVPSWTGTIQGAAGVAVGADTKLWLQDHGTTTDLCIDVVSVSVTPGLARVPLDVVTQCEDSMQGRAGYTTAPGDTIIEVQAFLDTGWQDDWDLLTPKVLKYYQVNDAGGGWVVMAPKCYLMEAPEYSEANESVMHTLRFICHEDDAAGTTELAKSKILVGMF